LYWVVGVALFPKKRRAKWICMLGSGVWARLLGPCCVLREWGVDKTSDGFVDILRRGWVGGRFVGGHLGQKY